MYVVTKTKKESEELAKYIKEEYYKQVNGANFEKWADPIKLGNGWALPIDGYMKEFPVPEFIKYPVKFIDELPREKEDCLDE